MISDKSYPEIEFTDLVETALALHSNRIPVANSLKSEGRLTFIITGPNSGGKSVFARSIGQAVILAQSGLPVAAKMFYFSVFRSINAYFSKSEDRVIGRGRFEKELVDM